MIKYNIWQKEKYIRDQNGRYVKSATSERRKQWNGLKFGKLTVVETQYGLDNGSKITKCKCVCECGNEVITTATSLQQGKRKSCGCDRLANLRARCRKDLTGQRFGRLVVTKMIWAQPHTLCECDCDCGAHITTPAVYLTCGEKTSCGCYQKQQAAIANTKDFTHCNPASGVKFIKQSRQNDKGQWLWICKCGVCGKEFEALPAKILNLHITSCGCRIVSLGEEMVEQYLINNDIIYKKQFSIPDCKNKRPLRFDFAVFDEKQSLKGLIEFDGRQHFEPIEYWGGKPKYLYTQLCDSIKTEYCKNNHIPLVRLPYTLTNEEITTQLSNIIYA